LKILVKCLQAIENLIVCANILPVDAVTDTLSITKTLQYYGLHLDNIKQTTRHITQLRPSDIHIPILNQTTNNDQSDNQDHGEEPNNATRKKRYTKKSNQRSTGNTSKKTGPSIETSKVPLIEYSKTNGSFSFRLQNTHLSSTTTSESESSDVEVNNVRSKFFIEKCNAKVREAALNVLQIAFQVSQAPSTP
jgi:hypothetical protein